MANLKPLKSHSSLLGYENTQRLNAIKEALGVTRLDAIEYVLDFYDLKDLGALIRRIKEKRREGLTAVELAHLRVLKTFLNSIVGDL